MIQRQTYFFKFALNFCPLFFVCFFHVKTRIHHSSFCGFNLPCLNAGLNCKCLHLLFTDFEPPSARERRLWFLCVRLTQLLQIIWLHSSSNRRNCASCFEQKTDTASSSKETTLWPKLALLRLWKREASEHISSSRSKHQEVAGCLVSHASQL